MPTLRRKPYHQRILFKKLLRMLSFPLWLEQLQQIHVNSKKGGEQGAKTRKEKKSKGSRQRKTIPESSLSEELCSMRFKEDRSNDSLDLVNWISCDGCYFWHHLVCVDLHDLPDRWLCIKCTEQW